MASFTHQKYAAFKPVAIENRQWPDQVITKAPTWCSVDLRDGNQALIEPMTVAQKLELFQLLVDVGFKQIEVGFPAASQPDYDFVRHLIDNHLIPDDVTIQVLVQTRDELLERTFAALHGAKKAIVHIYNSTSTVQREQVFGLDKAGITAIAVNGAKTVKRLAAEYPDTEWTFQYSPESFTGTELDYAVEVVNAVMGVWQPSPDKPAIINLPATVEMSTPNIYADQIEWFCRQVDNRDAMRVSLHTHNDRGCAVAAAELAVMAGADRVEGTLFGNGERTGNMDIITMAMNLYSQGVDPELDFSAMDRISQVYKTSTSMPIHPRHPYAGELVFTAFSGSHQDAIKKCINQYQPGDIWNVAYLPIDPSDLGRSYEEVIRINSQSGKGGVAYILERDYGLQLPRWLQINFSAKVQEISETQGGEISSQQIWQLFCKSYLTPNGQYQLNGYQISRQNGEEHLVARLAVDAEESVCTGTGSGAVAAFVNGLERQLQVSLSVIDYSAHALESDNDTEAIAYVMVNINGDRHIGVAISHDITGAPMKAVLAAINDAKESKVMAESLLEDAR